MAGFVITWATQVGGRSTISSICLTGIVVLGLVLQLAQERLAVAAGQLHTPQAEAAMIINSHPAMIGATGAARPTAFLGPASTADFAFTVVAAQSGIVGIVLSVRSNLYSLLQPLSWTPVLEDWSATRPWDYGV